MHETEQFWADEFGDDYTIRNMGRVKNNIGFFAKIARYMDDPETVLEFGAGAGENIKALKSIWPEALYHAVEINSVACMKLAEIEHIMVNCDSIYTAQMPKADLVLTKGLLIHIPPEHIEQAYAKIYEHARKYILLCEYYNPTLVAVPYRGHAGRLWKRDFAGDMLDKYRDLRLVEYGFVYNRDNLPQDDITWFLMEKE